jgi:hypothetical protein
MERPEFSENGRRVYDAVKRVNSDDPSLAILAKRIGRAVTLSDAGYYDNKPLGIFMLAGAISAPIYSVVEAVADTWIGKPWSETQSFTHIPCAAYRTPFPNVLGNLVGPLPPTASGESPQPLLGRIDWPNFAAREGEMLKKLWTWKKKFQDKWGNRIKRMPYEAERYIENFLLAQIIKEQSKLWKEADNAKQFVSVVFFDGIEQAGPDLASLVYSILHTGSCAILPHGSADFTRSLIFVSTYEAKTGIGFTPQERCDVTYESVRGRMLRDPLLGPVAEESAGNIFAIRDRSKQHQLVRIQERISELKERFGEIGISLDFNETALKFVSEEAYDKTLDAYTESRLRYCVQRHIFYSLALPQNIKRLCRGACANFSFKPEISNEELQCDINIVNAPDAPTDRSGSAVPADQSPALSADALRRILGGCREDEEEYDSLIQNPIIQALNKSAKETLERLSQ